MLEYFEANLRLDPCKKVIQSSSGSAVPSLKSAARPLSSSSRYPVGGKAPTSLSGGIGAQGSSVGPIAGDLYSVIEHIFKRYWTKEFDDTATSNAFFANIQAVNAADFGLSTFATESTSLTIINTRIQARHYQSIAAFKFDMETMFDNILKYFPVGSPPHLMAQHLYREFQTTWAANTAGLR